MKVIYLIVLPILSLSMGVALLLGLSEKISSLLHKSIFGSSTNTVAGVMRTLFRLLFALLGLALVISSFISFIVGIYAD